MSKFILDGTEINSHDWRRTIPAPLSRTDHRRFQAELDKLAGIEPDGTKRLKLIWMPSFERWDGYLQRWIPFRCVKAPREIAPSESGAIIQATFDFIGVPRYAVVGLLPEDSRAPAAERARYGFDADGAVRAPDRTVREYILLLPIWDHDPRLLEISEANKCCAEMSSLYGKKCWGKYRAPDEGDLNWLRSQLALMQGLLTTKPHERASMTDMAKLLKPYIELRRQQDARQSEEHQQMLHEGLFATINPKTYSFSN
ncbi:MAG TPA: hypothetical protein PKC13_24250 [Blastocatellia bacterium]|nr:hypothetical protein [Blastocatellia bacterium]